MENSSIIFVGGFGASVKYSEKMCTEVQKLTCRKVHNFSLHHGLTLEGECEHIIRQLEEVEPMFTKSSYILMGFSTGCLICMFLSKRISTQQVILLNPAEVLTRLNLNILDSLVEPEVHGEHRNIISYAPILQRTGCSVFVWKIFWYNFEWIWWMALFFLGSSRVARIYYSMLGKGFHEPKANELQRLLFAPGRKFKDLKKTLTECILKPSLQAMIYGGKTIHIVQGYNDVLYIPYVSAIYSHNKNVILHKTIGDHHMIYHHPIETAQKIFGVIKVKISD